VLDLANIIKIELMKVYLPRSPCALILELNTRPSNLFQLDCGGSSSAFSSQANLTAKMESLKSKEIFKYIFICTI